jgi:hypothetical protein
VNIQADGPPVRLCAVPSALQQQEQQHQQLKQQQHSLCLQGGQSHAGSVGARPSIGGVHVGFHLAHHKLRADGMAGRG